MDSSLNLLIEETQPVVEHTVKIVREVLNNHYAYTKSKAKVDDESIVDICSHLALVYHLLVVATADSIIHKKQDINTNTNTVLQAIDKLLSDCLGEVTKASMEEAITFVDKVFARAKGNA